MFQQQSRMKVAVGSALKICVFVLLALSLVGCVTTTTSSSPTPMPKKQVTKKEMLQKRLQLALGYISSNDNKRARTHLQKATEIDGSAPELHDVWALLYQREQEYQLAESHYKLALQHDASFTRGRNNYGLFLLRQGRHQDAVNQFSLASADVNYPKRAEVFLAMGVGQVELGQVSQAKASFNKTVALNPGIPLPYLELAILSYNEGDLATAKKWFDSYDQMKTGNNPRALWLGVRLFHKLRNLDKEASLALALKNLFPQSSEYAAYRTWLSNGRQ